MENLHRVVTATQIPWRAAGGPAGPIEVVIPANVTMLGKGMFSHDGRIRRIVFHKNMLIIDRDAFLNCPNIHSVSVANTVGIVYAGKQPANKLFQPGAGGIEIVLHARTFAGDTIPVPVVIDANNYTTVMAGRGGLNPNAALRKIVTGDAVDDHFYQTARIWAYFAAGFGPTAEPVDLGDDHNDFSRFFQGMILHDKPRMRTFDFDRIYILGVAD